MKTKSSVITEQLNKLRQQERQNKLRRRVEVEVEEIIKLTKYTISFGGTTTEHFFKTDDEAFKYAESLTDSAAMANIEKKGKVWDSTYGYWVTPNRFYIMYFRNGFPHISAPCMGYADAQKGSQFLNSSSENIIMTEGQLLKFMDDTKKSLKNDSKIR